MINARDTFYITLRDRIAALNPARTLILRGVQRPGVLVEENELASTDLVLDVFALRWTALAINTQSPLPLASMSCEIHYATAGNASNGGMDRGRLLAQMDAELSNAVRTAPGHVIKQNFTTGGAMATYIFWSDVTFAPTITAAEQLQRTATVDVFSYQEAGE
jgi:hypothetical protein